MSAPVRPAAAAAGQSTPVLDVTALAATGDHAPVYVADQLGLYRSSAAPFSAWTLRATLTSLLGNAQAGTAPAIGAISPNPRTADDLVLAIGGSLFRSTDGGISATHTTVLSSTTGIARAQTNPATLFTSGSDGRGGRILKSTDDGRTWTTVYITPVVSPGIASLDDVAVDPTDPSHVLAAEGLYHTGALIESRDGGATWHSLPNPRDVTLEQPDLIAIDPANPSSIWADWSLMGNGRLEHSADGGATWQDVSQASWAFSVTTAVGFDRAHGRVYVAEAVEGGKQATRIYWTGDGGAHFSRFAPSFAQPGRRLLVLGTEGVLLTGDATTPLTIFRLRSDGSAGPRVTPALVGTSFVPPVVSLFAGSQDGTLYALNEQNGDYVWSVHTGGAVSSPTVFEGTVYAGSFDGTLYAVDAQTGSVRWRFTTRGAVSAPAAANGLVYFGSRDHGVYAVDAQRGVLRWRRGTGGDVGAPAIAGATVYVRSTDHFLYALDVRTGAVRWRFDTGGPFTGGPVVVAAGLVYAGTEDGRIVALDAGTGKLRWQFSAPGGSGGLPASLTVGAVANGLLYAGSTEDAVIALDAGSGKLRWRVGTAGPIQAAPAVANGLVYAGCWDHSLYALDARTGALRWRLAGPTPIYTSPRVRAGAVFISFANGQLQALDARTGHLLWRYQAGATYTTPAVQTPADPAAPGPAGARYFAQTGHNLGGAFLTFWQRYGGLAIFGYPLTEPFTERGQQVQYMQRFALTLANGAVVTAPLGRVLTAGRHFAPVTPFRSTATRLYFASTGHSLSGRFLTFWRDHHGAGLLGAPISEVIVEGNGDGSGRRYPLQWFERGRLEYHPELAGTSYAVELGLLGKQELQARDWLT
ncbi:MAG TPA: PQQ-binding-like beta-propeller repeat protein [Chloroflexota bacterium]|nr:PQQ-binding-like beta-propeller repeat protein [Chloroflexota bacterium]